MPVFTKNLYLTNININPIRKAIMKEFEKFADQQIDNVYAIRGGGSCDDCAGSGDGDLSLIHI